MAPSVLLGDKCRSVSGLENTDHNFCVGSFLEIGSSNKLGHPVLEKHTFDLKLEVLNLCGVYARSRTQEHVEKGRKHDSKKFSHI